MRLFPSPDPHGGAATLRAAVAADLDPTWSKAPIAHPVQAANGTPTLSSGMRALRICTDIRIPHQARPGGAAGDVARTDGDPAGARGSDGAAAAPAGAGATLPTAQTSGRAASVSPAGADGGPGNGAGAPGPVATAGSGTPCAASPPTSAAVLARRARRRAKRKHAARAAVYAAQACGGLVIDATLDLAAPGRALAWPAVARGMAATGPQTDVSSSSDTDEVDPRPGLAPDPLVTGGAQVGAPVVACSRVAAV